VVEPVDVLVCLDDGNASGEEEEGEQLECAVGALAESFGFGGCGRLKDENGENKGHCAQGLEDGMRREEGGSLVGEDGGPHDSEDED